MNKLAKNQKGSVLLIFLAFVVLIFGILSLSIYVGGRSRQAIKIMQTSEMSNAGMAAHASQGLNFIALNNQAIAANLQVNNASLVIAYYGGLIRALFTDLLTDFVPNIVNLGNLQATLENLMGPKVVEFLIQHIQKDIFNVFNLFGITTLQSSSGLTIYNQFLRDYWLIGSIPEAFVIKKELSPYSIGVPSRGDAIPFDQFIKIEELNTSTPGGAICMVTSAKFGSRPGTHEVKDFLNILSAPLYRYLGESAGSSMELMNNLLSKLASITPIKFGVANCNITMTSPFKAYMGDPNAVKQLANFAMFSNAVAGRATNFITRGGGHPTSGSCSIVAGTSAGLLSQYLQIPLPDTIIQIQQATMIMKFEAAGVDKIKFSQLFPEKCTTPSNPKVSASCNLEFKIKGANAYMCPFYDKTQSIFLSKCMGLGRWALPKTYYPKRQLADRIGANCELFKQWQGLDENKGRMLVDLDEQTSEYLKDSYDVKKKIDNDKKESSLGFMYIEPEKLEAFHQNMNFKMAIADPIWSGEEARDLQKECQYKLEGGAVTKCKLETFMALGTQFSAGDYKSNDPLQKKQMDILKGGSSVFEGKDVFTRMQWGLSKIQVNYIPGPDDPVPSKDHLSLMWPAWSLTPKEATFSDFFKEENGQPNGLVKTLDYILGN